ncbi:transposase [Marinobacter sp. NP-4(2019)]|uniref:REP-associated tyrosine transposase n=1 Tax=Marinobacter sp. NP-4(2019) TaxID=2488665 RepID=UPI000FC3CDE4|nr:transposase [Marinobacter sp. NP-4(2019)]AZT84472.1 transposase [Marinobacter sp. NP-4(2019)]
MMNYRRSRVLGGTYFFTVVTANRAPIFQSTAAVSCLRESVRSVQRRYPFSIDAMVVLPDHIHCIWSLPDGDAEYSRRWRLIKTGLTKRVQDIPGLTRRVSGSIWQKRFWEHMVRDDLDFERHVDYIHFNPVKHGYVSRAWDWPYSSFHRYVREGVLPVDWAVSEAALEGVGRE